MLEGDKIKVAQGENPCYLLLNQANRHGLIAGASGTGKTVTMKVLAEGFAQAGVPVFMADVKGDVTGMAQPGDDTEKVRERAAALGAAGWEPRGCDVRLWDMLGGDGVPVRITISDMGPDLLARLLGLTDVQRGVLAIAFRMADDNGMLLIDLKDLRAMLGYLSEHASEVETLYGRVSSQSVGAIQRALLTLEDAGGDIFFGEPALDITDWLVTDDAGQGTVNILNAAKLMASPQVYAMFLLWMLSEIYELLPEAGDLPKPKLVFFFDEAHLLFDDMPKELTDKIVQTVKLIRSKGVGVYFVSQSPADIPDEVLAQLSNRIQHGLRAYTPAEQKAVRAAAAAFRENPAFDSAEALLELGTGEALVSLLNEDGQPSIVERARVLPPECRMAAADTATLEAIGLRFRRGIAGEGTGGCIDFTARGSAGARSAHGRCRYGDAGGDQRRLVEKYGEAIDRESAYEKLAAEKSAAAEADALAAERAQLEKERAEFEKQKAAEADRAAKAAAKEEERAAKAAEREAERAQKAAEERSRAPLELPRNNAEQAMKMVSSVIGRSGATSRQLFAGLFGNLRK